MRAFSSLLSLFVTAIVLAGCSFGPTQSTLPQLSIPETTSSDVLRRSLIGNTLVLGNGSSEYHLADGTTAYRARKDDVVVQGTWRFDDQDRICYTYLSSGSKEFCWLMTPITLATNTSSLIPNSFEYAPSIVQTMGQSRSAGAIVVGDSLGLQGQMISREADQARADMMQLILRAIQ